MRSVETSIDMRATPAAVWRVLTDFGGHPQWNPFIRSIEGHLKPGERLAIRIVPPGRSGMTFRPRILAVDEQRQLRWIGHLLLPGIFDGEHHFRIEPIPDGVRFHQGETFSGILALFMPASSFAVIRQGFAAMNQALKERVEAQVGI